MTLLPPFLHVLQLSAVCLLLPITLPRVSKKIITDMHPDKSSGFLLDFIILDVSITLNSVYHILFETPKFEALLYGTII